MTYDFYANTDDRLDVLRFILDETDLRIFDLASSYGCEIAEYKKIEELSKRETRGRETSLTFQLWSPRHKGQPLFRKVDLDPKYCDGHTFRYMTEGWGLIQLYFGTRQKDDLYHSHLGHFEERGALKWEGLDDYKGKVNEWDWSEIRRTSGRLKYRIHQKMAVRKIGSMGVLDGAHNLSETGIEFRW